MQERIVDQPILGPPKRLRIPADGPIEFVGRLEDGTQYMTFITGAVPDGFRFDLDNEDWRKVKCWIGVLHLFDPDGNHLRTEAIHGGYDTEGRDAASEKAGEELRKILAPFREKNPTQCDIHVKLFSVVLDGITHGLIYGVGQPEEDGPTFEWVMLEPRDVMFHPSWDSGEWST
jgi:hypothetical protein